MDDGSSQRESREEANISVKGSVPVPLATLYKCYGCGLPLEGKPGLCGTCRAKSSSNQDRGKSPLSQKTLAQFDAEAVNGLTLFMRGFFGLIAILLALVCLWGSFEEARTIGTAGMLPVPNANHTFGWVFLPVAGAILAAFAVSQFLLIFFVGDDSDEDARLWSRLDPQSRGLLRTKKWFVANRLSPIAPAIALVSQLANETQMHGPIWSGLVDLRPEPYVALLLTLASGWLLAWALKGNNGPVESFPSGQADTWVTQNTWTLRVSRWGFILVLFLVISIVYGAVFGIQMFGNGDKWYGIFWLVITGGIAIALIGEYRNILDDFWMMIKPPVLKINRDIEGEKIILNGVLDLRRPRQSQSTWKGSIVARCGENNDIRLQESKFIAALNKERLGNAVFTFRVAVIPSRSLPYSADVVGWTLTLINPENRKESISLALPREVFYVEEYPVSD